MVENSHNIKRVISKKEFEQAFNQSMNLSKNHPTLLRAYGWYRKGLYAEDPFDIFYALWNSIEIVASKYHPKSTEIRGSKDQIWESFKAIWGDCESWPLIGGNKEWIKSNYETRKDIAPGLLIYQN